MSLPDLSSLVTGGLAEKITAGARAVEGEHKPVTVLFVDVKGSMDLAARLDDEEWHATIDGLYSVLCSAVHRYEGTVGQFTGDGIMALFGAPVAHEDHPVRACLAALDLLDATAQFADEVRREHDVELAVRLGLNSGEVVLGRIGDDLRLEHTAVGHTVGLAQRMEQLATPGTACLSENTAKLLSNRFELKDRGPVPVKGVSAPVRIYELGPVRRVADTPEAAGRTARFVGREHELSVLQEALPGALAGEGCVVGITGEPGVGKSRLCQEFLREQSEVPVYSAQGVAHGQAAPFVPVLQLLRAFYGVDERDPPDVVRARIRDRLAGLDGSFEAELPLVYELLGVADPDQPLPVMDPEARQRQLLSLVGRQVRAAGRTSPSIVLLEDLHWFDQASAAVVGEIARSVEGTRTLVLATFRPGFSAAWMSDQAYRQLELEGLDDSSSSELVQALVGAGDSLQRLSRLIFERAEGNPFFVEELIQTLAETDHLEGEPGAYRLVRPVESELLPATVQALLAARIDRQGDDQKRLLQSAAVIGRAFTETLLRAVTELTHEDIRGTMADLKAAQLVVDWGQDHERAYAFKHALTQQVAYRSLLGPQRAILHARVAEASETEFAGSLDGHSALISHHWERARDPLRAGRWAARAAGWAGFASPLVAARQWRRVVELSRGAEMSEEQIQLGLTSRAMVMAFAWRQGLPEGQSLDEFEHELDILRDEGLGLAEAAGQRSAGVLMRGLHAGVHMFLGHLEEGWEKGMQLIELARSIGDIAVELTVCPLPLWSAATLGRWEDVERLADHELTLCASDPTLGGGPVVVCPGAWIRVVRGYAHVYAGRPAQAMAELEEAISIARTHDDVEVPGWAYLWLAHAAHFLSLDDRFVLELAEEAMSLAKRAATAYSRGWAHCTYGLALLHAGKWSAAQNALDEALHIWRPRRIGTISEPLALAYLSRAELGAGRSRDAVTTAKEAIAKARAIGTMAYEIDAQLALARAVLAEAGRSGSPTAEAALQRADKLVQITGSTTLRPDILIAQADLAEVQSDSDGRNRALRSAELLRRDLQGASLDASH